MHCRKGMQLNYNKKLLVNTTGWKNKRYETCCLTQNVKQKKQQQQQKQKNYI